MATFNRERLFVRGGCYVIIGRKYVLNIVFFIIYEKYFLFFKYCLYLEQIEDDIVELNHTSIGGYI